MNTLLLITQIVLAVLLVLAVLMQTRSAGLGGVFGQETGGVFRTRRGLEKLLFQATIGLAVGFIALSLLLIRLR